MHELTQALSAVIHQLISGDPEIYEIILLSLKVSLTALIIGMALGIPAAALLALTRFPGQKVLENIVYTLMGLPPVLAGLVVYLFISRKGPLGEWELLFTPGAMIIAQAILVFPIITGLSLTAIRSKEKYYTETAISLGAAPWQVAQTVLREASSGITAGVITAFGRAIAEVGAVMLVGGNIAHSTRVMTTAIVLETRQGNFSLALGLGLVLLVISYLINTLLQFFQGGGWWKWLSRS